LLDREYRAVFARAHRASGAEAIGWPVANHPCPFWLRHSIICSYQLLGNSRWRPPFPNWLLGESKMAARIIQGIPKSVDFCKLKFIDIGKQRRRRAVLAFATGSAHLGGGDDF
jgi:hypothetical protein